MPLKPPKACRYPGCGQIIRESYCQDHQGYAKKLRQEYDRNREKDPFYNSPAWVRSRGMYAKKNPLCKECLKRGLIVPMKIVDHIVPIKHGGEKLSWSNFRSLCQECHNRKTGEDKRKYGK